MYILASEVRDLISIIFILFTSYDVFVFNIYDWIDVVLRDCCCCCCLCADAFETFLKFNEGPTAVAKKLLGLNEQAIP